MICTSTSGITISSSERPNIVRGASRLSQPLRRRPAGAVPLATSPASTSAAAAASVGLERIAGAANRMEIAWEARVVLDLPAQPHHLHVDVAHIAAEMGRLRQLLARDRLAGALCQAAEEAG